MDGSEGVGRELEGVGFDDAASGTRISIRPRPRLVCHTPGVLAALSKCTVRLSEFIFHERAAAAAAAAEVPTMNLALRENLGALCAAPDAVWKARLRGSRAKRVNIARVGGGSRLKDESDV